MINAALDPLNREALTPNELVRDFSIIKAQALCDKFSKFPPYEDILNDSDHNFFRGDDLPEAVLFISHRWLSSTHPDPDGDQFAALKVFLSCIREICQSASVTSKGFRRRLKLFFRQNTTKPNAFRQVVFSHGGYQAAYFLGAYNPFNPSGENRTRLLSLGENVLSRIGVWYDYSSLPQGPAARGQLVAALGRMHELLGASNLISLRRPDDEYGSRAWCAAEVSTDPDIERSRFRKICLRVDKTGSSFPEELLLDQPEHFTGIAEFVLGRLKRAESGIEAVSAIEEFIDMVGSDAEDNREFPLFFVKRKPWIFEGQREFMVLIIHALGKISESDEQRARNSSSFSLGFDIAKAVAGAAKSVGMKSSEEADIPYTALLILYARHRGAPKLARLFSDSMQRHLAGRTTILARYRESREPYNERCWYRFEDQIRSDPAVAWSDDP